MYGDVDAVAMLVENLYHLLIAVTLRHADETAELTHTMIYMHHVVADFELLNLLQRKGHLSATGLVALEVILMEAVEYLVVGKYADAQIIVGKALVNGVLNRRKGNGRLLSEDIFQTLVLLLTVGTYIYMITLKEVILKGLNEHVEVLVKKRLDGDGEFKS